MLGFVIETEKEKEIFGKIPAIFPTNYRPNN